MAEANSELLCMVRASIDDMTAERGSFVVGTEQAKEMCEILSARIREFEAPALTCDGELGVAVRAGWLEGLVVMGDDKANTAGGSGLRDV